MKSGENLRRLIDYDEMLKITATTQYLMTLIVTDGAQSIEKPPAQRLQQENPGQRRLNSSSDAVVLKKTPKGVIQSCHLKYGTTRATFGPSRNRDQLAACAARARGTCFACRLFNVDLSPYLTLLHSGSEISTIQILENCDCCGKVEEGCEN
jgi:hypothetical protein